MKRFMLIRKRIISVMILLVLLLVLICIAFMHEYGFGVKELLLNIINILKNNIITVSL